MSVFAAGCGNEECVGHPWNEPDYGTCPGECMFGYGIADDDGGLSDCNRAVGFTFRAEDCPHDVDTIKHCDKSVWVWVEESDLPRLGKDVQVFPDGPLPPRRPYTDFYVSIPTK